MYVCRCACVCVVAYAGSALPASSSAPAVQSGCCRAACARVRLSHTGWQQLTAPPVSAAR